MGYETPEARNSEKMGGLEAESEGAPAVTAAFAELEGSSTAER